jgi:predicted alpha/beta-hydrolase family hydrolase
LNQPKALPVALETGAVTALVYEADRAVRDQSQPPEPAALILAHGAGAGQHSAFMVEFSRSLAGRGLDVVTFNFPYTEQKRQVPDRRPVLESCYRAVIGTVLSEVSAGRPLFIGGKSMGGRIATQVAAADRDLPVKGLVLLGYPLHPPGRPAERRDSHLPSIERPLLFVQGSRDVFGTPEELRPVTDGMAPRATLYIVEGGDHSFKVSRSREQTAVHEAVQRTIVEWIESVRAAP